MLQYDRFLESLSLGVGVNLQSHDPLRLNVGFLLNKSVGFSRIFELDLASVEVGGELAVSNLSGELRFTRTGQGLYGHGTLTAEQTMECARCLRAYQQGLEAHLDELFVYPAEEAEDPLLAIPETGILDLHPLLREMFILDLPLQPLCQHGCNGLCPICGKDLNHEQCSHPDEEIDPRLAPLKRLLTQE